MKNRNMIFDFTQCYPKRKEPGLKWHDCSAIGGSRLDCSRDAEEKIKALIAPAGVSGIHFIDSGDYHYISKIMTDFIKEPFTLVLIDHHTDMQDASLGGDILSCGNWAKKVLQENPYLQRLVLIGQEKKALDKLQSGARQQETDGKLVEISYEELKNGKAHEKIKELPDEARIADAIEAAGGVTENADLDEVNLAFVLSDGQKIYIPNKNEKEISGEKVYITAGSGNNVIVEDKVERGKKQKVNINEAKQEDFEQLPGIGPSIAKKIIEYREQNGKFTSIDELQEVKGIGEAKFENIKEYIMVK